VGGAYVNSPRDAIDALAAELVGRGVEIGFDDLDRRCVSRDTARRLLAERGAAGRAPALARIRARRACRGGAAWCQWWDPMLHRGMFERVAKLVGSPTPLDLDYRVFEGTRAAREFFTLLEDAEPSVTVERSPNSGRVARMVIDLGS
jgi:hypothetical protein